jgi:hypothetical protein
MIARDALGLRDPHPTQFRNTETHRDDQRILKKIIAFPESFAHPGRLTSLCPTEDWQLVPGLV